jgi:hypothetical protein
MNPKESFVPQAKIEFAKEDDIDGVLDVQESVLLANKDQEDNPGKSGFLATKIDRATVEEAIRDGGKEIFLIIGKDSSGNIAGYFLAYNLTKWIQLHPNWVQETGVDPKIVADNKIMYGKHVASNKTIPGVGRKLDNYLFDLAKEQGYNLYIGEICEGPIKNEKSINLHTGEFGMRKISEYNNGNNTFGIYLKDL